MKTLLGSEEGSALVELALALPLFAFLLAGTINYGVFTERKMQATEAANAGAAFGAVSGNQKNTSGMINAAKAASPALSGLSATASVLYACTIGGTLVATPSCGSGVTPMQYVQVATTATVPALVGMAGLSPSITVNGQALYRVVN